MLGLFFCMGIQASIWLLMIAGLVGLLAALSGERHGGGVVSRPDGSIDQEPMVWHLGLPDKWVELESRPNAHLMSVDLLSWSFGILVAGLCALCGAVLLSLKRSQAEPSESAPVADRNP
jgi:hypothetical protein